MPSHTTSLATRPEPSKPGKSSPWMLIAAFKCLVILTLIGGLGTHATAGPPTRGDRILVWVDDAHTRQIEVDKVDPDEIADSSSFKLSLGAKVGGVSISVGWSRKKGVAFEEQAQVLIQRIRDLCKEFNGGALSLETYHRRVRRIFDAVGKGRLCRMELLVTASIDSADAGARLDEALGLDARDNATRKRALEATLAEFRELVTSVDQKFEASELRSVHGSASQESRNAVERNLADLGRSLDATEVRELEATEKITIWADRGRTRRIVVPRLDVSHLVEDLEESLGLRIKCSGPLFAATIGGDMVRTLHRKANYDQAATLLVVKYRSLCLEYNSGILSQEAYSERLLELFEAERLAFDARGRFLDQLDEQMAATRDQLKKQLGRADSALVDEMQARKKSMQSTARAKLRESEPDSLVERMSRPHQDQMDAWDAFQGSVKQLAIDPPRNAIEVWVDDARTRKVEVPELDTDLLAQNVETRLTLYISFMHFGPEAEWARKRGLEYGAAAQELVVKSKQLCMDYNAGLVPQETFDRRRAAIDASLDLAGRIQEQTIEFTRQQKDSARSELDRRLEMRRNKDR